MNQKKSTINDLKEKINRKIFPKRQEDLIIINILEDLNKKIENISNTLELLKVDQNRINKDFLKMFGEINSDEILKKINKNKESIIENSNKQSNIEILTINLENDIIETKELLTKIFLKNGKNKTTSK